MEARVRDLAESVVSLAHEQEQWCAAQADRVLSERGLRVDEAGRAKLARAVANAVQRASLTLGRAARGDFGDLPFRAITPPLPLTRQEESGSSKSNARASELTSLTIGGLFEAWWQEAKAAGRKPSTYESYEKTVRYLVAFLEHDNAARVTAEDFIAFKDLGLPLFCGRSGGLAEQGHG